MQMIHSASAHRSYRTYTTYRTYGTYAVPAPCAIRHGADVYPTKSDQNENWATPFTFEKSALSDQIGPL